MRFSTPLLFLLGLVVSSGCASTAPQAQPDPIKLTPLISEHAVLQRNQIIPVWGYTVPGLRVKAQFNGATVETLANSEGYFICRFPAMGAGGPYTMTITNSDDVTLEEITDLYIGEVWVAGGQSNMAWRMSSMSNVDTEDPAVADFPQIRFFVVPQSTQAGKLNMTNGSWTVAEVGKIDECSAIGYFFARFLTKELGVPVGIISSNWGGTRASGWISRKGLISEPELGGDLIYDQTMNSVPWWKDYDSTYSTEWLLEDHRVVTAEAERERKEYQLPLLSNNIGEKSGWADEELDLANWKQADLPNIWPKISSELDTNGTTWFRTSVNIPEDMVGEDLTLHLGAVDKIDITYFNGEKIGAIGKIFDEDKWGVYRVYTIPAELVKAGENTLAVRNITHFYAGGLTGPAEEMYVTDGEKNISILENPWYYRIETNLGKVVGEPTPGSMYYRSFLYENMIQPLLPVGVAGVIWYQGESDSWQYDKYCKYISLLIKDWRYNFEQPKMPFIQVQLAGYAGDTNWEKMREAQFKAAMETGNLIATAHDLGESYNIHPERKQEVGKRLAMCALKQAYGWNVPAMGPVATGAEFNGDTVVVTLNATDGLNTPNNAPVVGVVVDGDCSDVTVETSGNKLYIKRNDGKEIASVSYAWMQDTNAVNLYGNSENLPVFPFQFSK